MEKKNARQPKPTSAKSCWNDNSAAAQRERLLVALKCAPVDTVYAYRQLDILHVPRRVFELRKAGYAIRTSWVTRITEQGIEHRVGIYSLEERTNAPNSPELQVAAGPAQRGLWSDEAMVDIKRVAEGNRGESE